jgi:hypothetical protein
VGNVKTKLLSLSENILIPELSLKKYVKYKSYFNLKKYYNFYINNYIIFIFFKVISLNIINIKIAKNKLGRSENDTSN